MTLTNAAMRLEVWLDRHFGFTSSLLWLLPFHTCIKVSPPPCSSFFLFIPVVSTQQVSGEARPLQLILQGTQPSTSDGVCHWVCVDPHKRPKLLCEQKVPLFDRLQKTRFLHMSGHTPKSKPRLPKSCLTSFLSTDHKEDVVDPSVGMCVNVVCVCEAHAAG